MSDQDYSTDEDEPDSDEYDGRVVVVDTGFYCVEVQGDPDDSFASVMDAVESVCGMAKAHVIEIDEGSEAEGPQYR